jgi:hypothetical protein
MQITLDIPSQLIADLVTANIETPHGDWFKAFKKFSQAATPDEDNLWYGDPKNYIEGGRFALLVHAHDKNGPQSHHLDLRGMKKGFEILAEKNLYTLFSILTGDWDSFSADAWMQCCLYGDIIFG